MEDVMMAQRAVAGSTRKIDAPQIGQHGGAGRGGVQRSSSSSAPLGPAV
jgi:hypothetical protein